jgi:hypothetical protein
MVCDLGGVSGVGVVSFVVTGSKVCVSMWHSSNTRLSAAASRRLEILSISQEDLVVACCLARQQAPDSDQPGTHANLEQSPWSAPDFIEPANHTYIHIIAFARFRSSSRGTCRPNETRKCTKKPKK